MSYPPMSDRMGTPDSGPAYQSRLTEARKNKLLDIKKREELKDVLVSKIREQLPEIGA